MLSYQRSVGHLPTRKCADETRGTDSSGCVCQDCADFAKKPAPTVSAEQLAVWVKALTSNEFKARQSATRTLIESGQAAVEPVAEAADSDDLEMTARCPEELRQLATEIEAAGRELQQAKKHLGH